MNALTRWAALALLALAPPPAAARSVAQLGTCMECFEVDIGDGATMYGCQFVGAGVDEGAKSCVITLSGCDPKGDCSSEITAFSSRFVTFGSGPTLLLEDPFTNAFDVLLHSTTTVEPALPELSHAIQLMQSVGQADERGRVRVNGSTVNGRWTDAGRFYVIRTTSAGRMFAVIEDAGQLEAQELFREPPASPRLIGWGLRPGEAYPVVALPGEGQSWIVRAAKLGAPPSPVPPRADDVGSLPSKAPNPDSSANGGGDDVTTIPPTGGAGTGGEAP